MRIKHFVVGVAAVAAVSTATAGGIAVAGSQPPDGRSTEPPTVKTVASTVTDRFAFITRPQLSADLAGRSDVQAAFDNADPAPDDPTFGADFSRAQPVTIAGSKARGWVFPAGDKVCVAIPDPRGGYGASCADLPQIERGHGTVAVGDSENHQVTVAEIVPDGAAPPTVVQNGEAKSVISPSNNVAAAVVSDTAKVDLGPDVLDTSKLRPPTSGREIG